mmetsp:Transcript_27193/g.42247  ORF Transcript_27193/g.42247 Transcript_27193/m.42247 type:complete len:521 (+) Transcript_27193:243-1805(+)|eukprot:CAMPEP_0196811606 /NCGR_PEP_ID=MMETSP1362-20130617/19018_1 /TAXON_ID=163516 /ORGANISM="Leptocylindrus danicus, Strain CCMP1856" /LENGTH=520 /DNA_ID=CAMNT_0042186951 /DNA_START=243 /DNA_END=1805 /DNA_ORIENTATION=+
MTTSKAELHKHHADLNATFNSGRTKSINWRKQQIKALIQGCTEQQEEIYRALSLDLGKPRPAAMAEVGAIIKEAKAAYYDVTKWMDITKVKTPLMFQPGTSSWLQPQPLGVGVIIGPWNFPFTLIMQPLLGAIAAGCCAMLKPSEFSPNTSNVLKKVVEEYLDNEAIRVILGDASVSKLLMELKWDKIFFTGGTEVGRQVAVAAAENLTNVTLELGGKNPVVVDKDIDMKTCVKRVLWAKMENAGQFCLGADYMVLHQDIADEFLAEFTELHKEFWGDNPGKPETIHKMPCRIVNERHWQRLYDMIVEIEEAEPAGSKGKIIYGGSATANKETLFIPMTLIVDPPLNSRVMGEEIFGPLLPIITVPSTDAAISFVNNMPLKHPLALYSFSKNFKVARRVIEDTMSGSAAINDVMLQVVNNFLPFGGVGASGMGFYHGKYSFDTFTHHKSVMKRSLGWDPVFGDRNYSLHLDTQALEKIVRIFFFSGGEVRDPSLFEVVMKKAVFVACLAALVHFGKEHFF